MNSVKIYGGKHANRKIHFNEKQIRPTSSRARTVLFDWLRMEINNKSCLDLFSGSGILAFDAMSQGADSVLCVDRDKLICQQIQSEADRIGESGISTKCLTYPAKIEGDFDICFMDPPFSDMILFHQSLKQLLGDNLVKMGGLLYIELPMLLETIDGFQLIKQKKIASVYINLFRKGDQSD